MRRIRPCHHPRGPGKRVMHYIREHPAPGAAAELQLCIPLLHLTANITSRTTDTTMPSTGSLQLLNGSKCQGQHDIHMPLCSCHAGRALRFQHNQHNSHHQHNQKLPPGSQTRQVIERMAQHAPSQISTAKPWLLHGLDCTHKVLAATLNNTTEPTQHHQHRQHQHQHCTSRHQPDAF